VGIQEPCPGHDVGLDQRWGDHQYEAGLNRLGDSHVEQGQLEACTDALEEVETRPADLGAARHVDGVQTFSELEVIFGLEALSHKVPCTANGLQDGVVVLATAGNALDDNVGEAPDQGRELEVCGVLRRPADP